MRISWAVFCCRTEVVARPGTAHCGSGGHQNAREQFNRRWITECRCREQHSSRGGQSNPKGTNHSRPSRIHFNVHTRLAPRQFGTRCRRAGYSQPLP